MGINIQQKLKKNKNGLQYILFTIPGVVFYSIFFVFPAIMGFSHSLTDWNGLSRKFNFIWLTNYFNLLSDHRVIRSLSFTFYYTFLLLIFTIMISIILALLLNMKIKFQIFFRAIYFFPAILSLITVGLIWNEIYYRVLPKFGAFLGIGLLSKNILSNINTAKYGILFVNLWQGVAIPTVLFIAGLQSIPYELYEAAIIDGANPFQKFYKITIPFLIPILNIVFIITLRNGLTTFDYIKAMTNGGPGRATESVALLI
ncbi:MAG: sugar ABC transporter permease, partial [Spirochaetes bacterium]|nr:sugar ABC transporter permease [Spirochaetota bacterium]